MRAFLAGYLGVYAATLLAFVVPLAAARFSRGPRRPPEVAPPDIPPFLIALAPSRHASESIPGFVTALRRQSYPADRFAIVLAIDRDDPKDSSVEVARWLGVQVHERFRPEVKTKGAALNAALADLRQQPFDAVIIFDIDARPEPDFLSGVAAHLRGGAQVIQTAPVSRPGQPNGLTRISELGQAMSRSHQRGRAILGLPGLLSGGGMVFSRASLERLNWETSTGVHLSDDGELNLRCCLLDIPVRFAPDLVLINDVPHDPRALRFQRRRWSAGYQELLVPYFRPLLKKALTGHWRVWDYVASLLFASTFSLLFTAGGLVAGSLGVAAVFKPRIRRAAALTAVPWAAHGLTYYLSLRAAGLRLSAAEFRQLPVFLAMRALAFIEGFGLAFRRKGRNPIPSRHPEDLHGLEHLAIVRPEDFR